MPPEAAPPPGTAPDGTWRLTITHLGDGGDGAAHHAGGLIHVPGTLPGETVLAHPAGPGRATLARVETPSPDRVAPPCPLFGTCGGCTVQHLAPAAMAAWKTARVRRALEKAGYPSPQLAPLVATPPGARRRMDLRARRQDGVVALGLHAAGSRLVVDMTVCAVLHPTLLALLPPLRRVLAALGAFGAGLDIQANLTRTGPDLLIRGDRPPEPADRQKLAAFAAAAGVARIAWSAGQGAPEPVAALTAPTVLLNRTSVAPPPGAFLQASAEGEAAIQAAVIAGLPDRPARLNIVELFAGIGTLSFALAERGRVRAYEGAADAVTALRRAAGGTPIQAECRDLTRQPLQTRDFAGVNAVVLDPPHAGAGPQMPPLAQAKVPRIVYVSCNPSALAKDAAILRQAGYTLLRATPIDQFLWSTEVETVAVFAAPARG